MADKETQSNDTKASFLTQTNRLIGLSGKVLSELCDVRQFFDSKRRNLLLKRGKSRLAALAMLSTDDTDPLVRFLDNEAIWMEDKKGFKVVSSRQNIIGAIIPEVYRVMAINHLFTSPKVLPNYDFGVNGPTHLYTTDKGYPVPSEGFKHGKKVIVPIKDWQYAGGIYSDNNKRDIKLLNRVELQKYGKRDLKPHQSVWAGNYYIDSENYAEYLADSNLEARNYNGIGVFIMPDGTELKYTLNNDCYSTTNLRSKISLGPVKTIEVSTPDWLVAMSRHMAGRIGAERWRFVGCEYNNGGSYFIEDQYRYLQDYNYFGFYNPKSSV